MALISPHLFQPLIRASDIAGILVFVGMAASSVVLIAILPIETKGRALKVSVLEPSVGLNENYVLFFYCRTLINDDFITDMDFNKNYFFF